MIETGNGSGTPELAGGVPPTKSTTVGSADVPMIERVRTDCLYPSGDQVEVVIFPIAGVIRVSDDGGAARSAWLHGRDDAVADRAARDAALRFGAERDGGAIFADAPTPEWRRSAVLAVANASARAAWAALEERA